MAQSDPALRFVIISKVAHPWFEEVHRGALAQAQFLEVHTGTRVTVDYMAPDTASVEDQLAVLAQAAAMIPSGIAIDPVDDVENLPALMALIAKGIPVVVFDAPSSNHSVPSVGNDFVEQGAIAARRLVDRIGASGEVALMQGVPTAPNHRQRFDAQLTELRRHPAIPIVDGGIDNDDIATATEEATTVLAAHPQLKGYLCCDASGPLGIAAAVRRAGRVGEVVIVGMDGIEPILEEIKAGVIESSSSTIPAMQGSMALLMLWQASQGMRIPQKIDTGIDFITTENVDQFLAAYR